MQTIQMDDIAKLEKISQKTDRVLLKVESVFPFDLFPDQLIIDENKINIIVRSFFQSEFIHSFPYSDVQAVTVETAPLFSTLKIISKSFRDDPLEIKFLRTQDAIKARRLIQGIMIGLANKIDFTKYSPQVIVQEAQKIGMVHND